MKHLHTPLTGLFLLAFLANAFAQASFTNKTSLLANAAVNSGVAIGVADMNADGLDDILRLDNGNELRIEYQAPGGLSFGSYTFGNVGDPWAIVAADVNNDGYNDILTGGYNDGVKILLAIDNGTDYQLQTLPGSNDVFVQGSNLADINNDGWLDAFTCHDNGESYIWGNNGAGSFLLANDWIDMSVGGSSEEPAAGNYGSIWTDFDNDRDQDLYIAKCRIGVNDPEDERRINKLWINDGQNNYGEEAEKYGLRIKYQSWTSDFGDIDNDGDLDCFITNHDHTLQLLENDGRGVFTDISAEAGLQNADITEYVQGIMRDFDNDGFLDLITAQPTRYFHNNGDPIGAGTTFTMSNPFGENFGSLAAGDLDHNGFVDLYTARQNGFNNPSNNPDKLWMNDGNDNHFLSVGLRGTESNRMGVGARIEIHGSWGIQVREVRAGESYGITNSLDQSFGLGQETEIEYVVVKWPSGQIDVLKDVATDQFITIEEGSSCTNGSFELDQDHPAICDGVPVTVSAPAGYDYLWSNGAVSQSITTDESINLSVVIVDDLGCAQQSNVAVIQDSPDETPSILAAGDMEFCQGGSVELVATEAASYLWSNGATTPSILATQTGDYTVTVEGVCDDFASPPVHVEVRPNAALPVTADVEIFEQTSATLEATGGSPNWFDAEVGGNLLAMGNTFETPVLAETTTYYVEDVNAFGGGIFPTGMVGHMGTQFNGNTVNGELHFNVFETCVLRQVTVNCTDSGTRIIELRDENDNVLQSLSLNLAAGQTVVDLDFTLEPGSGYKLSTNSASNQAIFGSINPRLYRSDAGVVFPYEVSDVLSIYGTSFGTAGFYYYFFDWKVERLPWLFCASERTPATVTVSPNSVQEAVPFGQMAVQPNPSATGIFTLDLLPSANGDAKLTVTDLTGKVILSENFQAVANSRQTRTIDLGTAPAGLYFLKITSGERASGSKLVKSE